MMAFVRRRSCPYVPRSPNGGSYFCKRFARTGEKAREGVLAPLGPLLAVPFPSTYLHPFTSTVSAQAPVM